MMEKVKLTEAQELDLQKLQIEITDVDKKVETKEAFQRFMSMYEAASENENAPLSELSPEQVALALCGWYEMKPAFSVGDWVTVTFNLHATVGQTRKITNIKKSHAAGHEYCYELTGQGGYFENEIRHATDAERIKALGKVVDAAQLQAWEITVNDIKWIIKQAEKGVRV